VFKYIKKFFLALNANAHPGDIAHAVALGLLLAFVPKANLLWAFLFFLTLFIRVNKGAFFLTLIAFSFLVPFADVATEAFGFVILSFKPFGGIFSALYDTPFVGLTRFNNTMVMGGLAMGLVAYIPMYALARAFVTWYRKILQPKIANSKVAKIIANLPLIKQIVQAPDIGGFGR
jgi:uncharacterized protein (TIGR03546 family)